MTLDERIREVLAELRQRQARLLTARGATYYETVYNVGLRDAYEEAADLLEAALAEVNTEQTKEKEGDDARNH